MKPQEPSDCEIGRLLLVLSENGMDELPQKNKLIFGRKFVKLKINHRIVIPGLAASARFGFLWPRAGANHPFYKEDKRDAKQQAS